MSGFENEQTILGILLYLFAVINVTIVSYYWINVRKRELAIRKAFGQTNMEIILMLIKRIFPDYWDSCNHSSAGSDYDTDMQRYHAVWP